jgi:hypothetical protein
MLDKGMIPSEGNGLGCTRFHHIAWNTMQFKTYKLLTSGIFHLIFLDYGWTQVNETMEN